VKGPDGAETVYFDGKPYGHVSGLGLKRRVRPGGLRAALRGDDRVPAAPAGDERPTGWDDPQSERYAADPAARVAVMDRQGIQATLIFPSAGVTIQNRMFDDPGMTAAHVDAFNRWLLETWSFDYQHRIIAPALVSLLDPDLALLTLDQALAHGARAVQILPGPAVWGTSPVEDAYDPFWALVNETGTLVTYHLGNSGYMERYSGDWGENPDPDGLQGPAVGRSAWQWSMLYRDRPIMDTIANLIFGNLFTRFPNVRVISVENGSIWVPYLLKAMDNMKGMGRFGPWKHDFLEDRPSEVFKQHVFVSPHHYGEDIGALVELLGPTQVLFGSDFPHPEGMSDIDDYREKVSVLAARMRRPDDEVRLVMRDNGMRLLAVDATVG
jgi:predicted TIM-barrel fold metal-dependent hydrolase